MSNIIIKVDSIQDNGLNNGKLTINASSYESANNYQVGISVDVNYSDLATTINAAIKDAIVAEFANASITIGVLDKKTLLGGAVGL